MGKRYELVKVRVAEPVIDSDWFERFGEEYWAVKDNTEIAAEDVSQQRVEVGCRFGVCSVINSEHAALQDFDGFVVFAESVEDGGFVVVENHLRGFIEQTVTAELKCLLEVLI